MSRFKEHFSLYPRNFKNRTIYYYRTYDKEGKRTPGISTGQTTRTAAKSYCNELMKKGRLIPAKEILFKDYARDSWIYGKCDYIKGRLARGFTVAKRYADNQRMNLINHIFPVFGDLKLNKITTKMIDRWLLDFLDKGLSSSTANQCLSALRTILNEAHRTGSLSKNPAKGIKPLKTVNEKKSIVSKVEFLKLFDPANLNEIWINLEYYIISLLAACTGMRLGEIQALRGENVYPGYVHVCYSYDRVYGLKDTKTHDSRDIPIYPGLFKMLHELKQQNSAGYLFSGDEGETPLYYTSIIDAFYKALAGIGITEEQRKKRNITFHSWRHFFNSMMRGKIEDYKLQRLTGHRTREMTEHYTHVEREDLQGMVAIQESFFISDNTKKGAAYVE